MESNFQKKKRIEKKKKKDFTRKKKEEKKERKNFTRIKLIILGKK